MAADPALLREVSLFSLLDDQETADLGEMFEERHFDKGDTLFTYGDAGDCLYVVRSGKVQVYVTNYEGEKIPLAEYDPGEVFGEISLLDGGARTATAVAIDDTECFTLDQQHLRIFLARHPHAVFDMLAAMGKRLRATDELVRSHVSRNVNVEEEEHMTIGQRVADKVATFGGSWTFIISFGVFLLVWMALNVWLAFRAWDPYPFILLNLALSTLAALQAPVIMMSQNRQAAKDRLKSDVEYQINLKAELEVAQLHAKVDKIYEEMQANFARIQRDKAAQKTAP